MGKGKVIQRIFELKDKFTPNLNKIQKGTLQFKRDVRDLKKVGSAAFKGIAVAITATSAATVVAGAGFAALVNKTAEAGDRIDKMSQRLGLTKQGFQELDFVLDQNGVSIDSLGMGMKSLSQQLYGLQTGTKTSSELFKELGLDASVAALSQEEAFKKVVSAFQGMEEGARKATLAQKVFGRNGQEMLPMLNQSKGSIEELTEKYNKLGASMSDQAIQNSVKFKDTLASLKFGIKGMFQSFSSPALGMFTNGIQWLIDKIPIFKKFVLDAFDSIKKAIEDNSEKFNSIKSTLTNIKNGILGTFGSDGEGGGALNWFISTAIPSVISGVASILNVVTNTYNFISDNWSLIAPLFYGIVAALTAYHVITKAIIIAKYAWTAAQWALNAALNANPIGLIVLGIGALIAAGVFLMKNWDDVKLAGQMVWNGILSAVEWGVNAYINFFNKLIEGVLTGVNYLIKQLNEIPGIDIGEVSYAIKNVDFGTAKFDTEGKDFNLGKKKEEESFEDILTQYDKQQELKLKTQETSNNDLIDSLNGNTEMLEATKGGGNTFNITVNASDLTAEEIADKLVPRIERKLFA